MSYSFGQIPLASHLNDFSNQINSIWAVGTGDRGYGQTEVPTVTPGDLITSNEWTALTTAIEQAALHQGTTLGTNWGGPSFFERNDEIIAHDGVVRPKNPQGFAIQPNLTAVVSNYLNVDPTNQMVMSNLMSDSNTASWSNSLVFSFTVTFSSENATRHFFNTGGQIRVSSSRSGGSTTPPLGAQNQSWTDLLAAVGTLSFGYTTTTGSGVGSSTGIGYYDLTGSYQTCWTANSSGAYAANVFELQARSNNILGNLGARGSILDFRLRYLDNRDNIWIDPFNNTIIIPDGVDGTFQANGEIRKTNFFTNIEIPTFAPGNWIAT